MTRRHRSPPRPARAAPPSAPRATTSRSPPPALGAVPPRAASPSDLCHRRGAGTRGRRRRRSAISQSLDGGARAALDLPDGYQTTVHDLAIDQHRAGTALPFAAPFFGAGELQVLSQYVKQTPCPADVGRHRFAV